MLPGSVTLINYDMYVYIYIYISLVISQFALFKWPSRNSGGFPMNIMVISSIVMWLGLTMRSTLR